MGTVGASVQPRQQVQGESTNVASAGKLGRISGLWLCPWCQVKVLGTSPLQTLLFILLPGGPCWGLFLPQETQEFSHQQQCR